jgi:hypothetical protein
VRVSVNPTIGTQIWDMSSVQFCAAVANTDVSTNRYSQIESREALDLLKGTFSSLRSADLLLRDYQEKFPNYIFSVIYLQFPLYTTLYIVRLNTYTQ